MFADDLNTKFAPGIEAALAGHPCTDNQFGALVSLAYNIGLGGEAHSTVQRLHNAGDYQGAAQAFLMWDKAGGRVVPALLRRRGEERALYLTPDGASAAAPQSAVITGPILNDVGKVGAPAQPHAIPAPPPTKTAPPPRHAPPLSDDDAEITELTREANPGVSIP